MIENEPTLFSKIKSVILETINQLILETYILKKGHLETRCPNEDNEILVLDDVDVL